MAPDLERTEKNAAKSQLLTMDVIELTLLLKSIGFRLESIDYDEFRCWNKKSGEIGIGAAANASATGGVATDADQHYINVEITCTKSKIVSNLSLKFNETDADHATDAHQAPDPTKSITCTCPKREPSKDNNSFWEVQSSGTFANPRRLSINALMGTEKGIDHDTSSNLLPVLSTRSIALTHVLTQVLLNQYKNNTQFGDISTVKDVDIKSIMRTIGSTNAIPMLANGQNAVLPPTGQIGELNLITPASSMNVTPTETESLMNVTIPKVTVNGQSNAALNETVSTESFASPKSDLFTSSPHPNQTMGEVYERDTNIVNNLKTARHSIDQALLSMDVNANVTRNLTQELAASATKQLQNDSNRNGPAAPQWSRMLSGRNASQANARSSMSALNRRASLGSIGGIGRMAPPAIISRFNMSKPNTTDRSANTSVAAASTANKTATPKLSLVRRTIGSITASVKTQNPTAAAAAATLKRPSSISRRGSTPSGASNVTPTGGTSAIRRSASTAKTLLPSKLAKK